MLGVLMFATGSFAFADPSPVDSLLFPLDLFSAEGNSPSSFFVAFQDKSLYETGFQIQWTFDKTDESSWQDAGKFPPLNAPEYSQFTGRRPGKSFEVLPRVCPPDVAVGQIPTTEAVYFRGRATVTHGISGIPQEADLVNGPWYVDGAIAGPCGPRNVAATLVSGQPKITWTNDPTPDPIKVDNWIYRSYNVNTLGSGQPIAKLNDPNSTEYTDTQAVGGFRVHYLVVAIRQKLVDGKYETSKTAGTGIGSVDVPLGGASPTPTVSPTGTPTPEFGAPSNLTAVLINSSTAKLDWQDNSTTESGFFVDFGQDSCACSGRIVIASPNTTTFTHTGLSVDKTYYYRVRAFRNSDGGITDPSNLAFVETPPAAPSNLRKIAATNTYVDLRWNDNSQTEDGFRVEHCNGTCGDGSVWTLTGTVPAGQVDFRDATVTGSMTRSYRVFATRGLLLSTRSNILTLTTPGSPLTPPSNLVASQIPFDGHALSLTWQNNDPDTQSYRIDYASVPDGPWGTLATGVATTSYIDSFALNAGQQRCYRVRAFNSVQGASDPSNISCAQTYGPQIPIDPTNLTATAISSSKIRLEWKDNSSNEEGFKLYRSTDGGANYTVMRTLPAGSPALVSCLTPSSTCIAHIDQFLRAATPYTYKVTAYNQDGESGPSNQVTETTLGPPIPEWVNPSPADQAGQNNVGIYSCVIGGKADHTVGVDFVKVTVYDTVHGTFANDPDLDAIPVDPTNGEWELDWIEYEFKPGRYSLAAYARMTVNGQLVFSQPAMINGWTIPADQAPCPITNPSPTP